MQHPNAPSAAPVLYPLGSAAPPRTPRVRVARHDRPLDEPHGQRPIDWPRALAAVDWTGRDPARGNARVLKAGGKTTVWRADLPRRDGSTLDAVLKVEPRRGLAGLLRAACGLARADQQWEGARRLGLHGIAPAETLAVLDAPGVRTLVLKAVPGPTLLEVLADPAVPVRRQHAVAVEVAEQLRALWRPPRFFCNRDHKPSNIVIAEYPDWPDEPSGGPRPILLDTGGFRVWSTRLADACNDARHDMLASLVLEPLGCGVPPRRTLAMRVLQGVAQDLPRPARHAWVRETWRAVAEAVAAHGDPTPKDNPLAPPRRAWELDPALAPPA